MKIMLIDVKKAHLYGVVEDDKKAYIELPEEVKQEGKCGRLRRWLYGMRPAGQAWEKDYTERLEGIGFERGKAAPTAFFNSKTKVRCVVHGDDFTFLGYPDALEEVAENMKSWYLLKIRGVLGGEPGDDEEVTILNRTLRWKVGSGKIEYEADVKHAKKICGEFGLGAGSKSLKSPAVKEKAEDLDKEDPALDKSEHTAFRGMAATANYLSQDRADIQYATKEICRDMATPKVSSIAKLKHLARYISGHPRLVWVFDEGDGLGGEDHEECIDVYTDSNWAGCLRTRRSTSGGIVVLDGGALKSWSSTQATVALSSGEAEYYALVKGAAEGLGIQALMKDLGWKGKVRINVDASAAKSVASRVGIGKIRHLDVKFMWIQEAVRAGRIVIRKVRGVENPADILTKPRSIDEVEDLLKSIGGYMMDKKKDDGKQRWADIESDGEVGDLW